MSLESQSIKDWCASKLLWWRSSCEVSRALMPHICRRPCLQEQVSSKDKREGESPEKFRQRSSGWFVSLIDDLKVMADKDPRIGDSRGSWEKAKQKQSHGR
eukprot:672172-Amphidinium_carterae.1